VTGLRSLTIKSVLAIKAVLATVGVLLTVAPTPAGAQTRPLAPFDSTARNIVESMQSDLQRLHGAQAGYYAAHHQYAMHTGQIPGFQTTHGTVITITPEGAAGYRAVATNGGLDGTEFDLVEPLPPVIDTTAQPPQKADSSQKHH
jgi:hypothetical protein